MSVVVVGGLGQVFMSEHECDNLRVDVDKGWERGLRRPLAVALASAVCFAVLAAVSVSMRIVFPGKSGGRPFCRARRRQALVALPLVEAGVHRYGGAFYLTDDEAADYYWMVVFVPSAILFFASGAYLLAVHMGIWIITRKVKRNCPSGGKGAPSSSIFFAMASTPFLCSRPKRPSKLQDRRLFPMRFHPPSTSCQIPLTPAPSVCVRVCHHIPLLVKNPEQAVELYNPYMLLPPACYLRIALAIAAQLLLWFCRPDVDNKLLDEMIGLPLHRIHILRGEWIGHVWAAFSCSAHTTRSAPPILMISSVLHRDGRRLFCFIDAFVSEGGGEHVLRIEKRWHPLSFNSERSFRSGFRTSFVVSGFNPARFGQQLFHHPVLVL